MRPDLRYSFQAGMQTNRITIRREFHAPKKLVWDCYTKAKLLDQWFAPEPFTAKTKSFEFREGGHWHFAMVGPDGSELDTCCVLTTRPNGLIAPLHDATSQHTPSTQKPLWHCTDVSHQDLRLDWLRPRRQTAFGGDQERG